jgi:hypothetical protein
MTAACPISLAHRHSAALSSHVLPFNISTYDYLQILLKSS